MIRTRILFRHTTNDFANAFGYWQRFRMEPHICAQYASEVYDKDRKALWDKLAKGYHEALGLELYYFHRSLFDCTLKAHRTVAKCVHEIDRIIECLHEVEEIIKARKKTFYLLNGLPASWREGRDLQATIIKPNQPDELVAAIKAREASLNRDQGIIGETVLTIEGRRYAGQGSSKTTRRAKQVRPERRDRSNTDKTLTCYYCKNKGDRRRECRKRKSDREKGIHVDWSNSPMPAVASATDMISRLIFTAFSSVMASTSRGQWLLDSRCSTHVTRTREHFSSYVTIATGKQKIHVVTNIEVDALGEGKILLAVWDKRGKQERNLVIPGVLHVPECVRNNLFSVSQLCNLGNYVNFHKSRGGSLRRDDGLCVRVEEVNRLYVLQTRSTLRSDRTLAVQGDEEDEEKAVSKKAALWHFRLAHLGVDAVPTLSIEDNTIPKLPVVPCCICTGCIYGKMVHKPFPSLPLSSKATQPLEIVHCDITGHVTPKSLGEPFIC